MEGPKVGSKASIRYGDDDGVSYRAEIEFLEDLDQDEGVRYITRVTNIERIGGGDSRNFSSSSSECIDKSFVLRERITTGAGMTEDLNVKSRVSQWLNDFNGHNGDGHNHNRDEDNDYDENIERCFHCCSRCTNVYKSRYALNRHVREKHVSPGKISCMRCKKKFQRRYQLKHHAC